MNNPLPALVSAVQAEPPVMQYAALTFVVWLLIFCVRRYAPSVWLRLEDKLGDNHVALSLPSVLAGAAMSAVASGGDVGQSWKGALAGAVAPLLHHALKDYTGADAVLDAAQAKLLATKPALPTPPAYVVLSGPTLSQPIPAAAPVVSPDVAIPVTVDAPADPPKVP